MLKIGLTGNIGSGKSVISEVFKKLCIPIYNADDKANLFFETPAVIEKIKDSFGDKIFNKQNKINRKNLAQIVFSDKRKLTLLNKIIHPLVIDDFERWALNKCNYDYIIMESAILYETGYSELFDKIIFVSAPESIRIARVIKRDGITEEEVRKRMNNQLLEKDKISKADYIIFNDDINLIIPQIIEINKLLSEQKAK